MNGTHDVFLSYKFEEKAEALAVKRALESAGLTCWMAPESISGGSSYADEIDGAIRGCSAFVLILSERAQSSPWIKKEIDVALNAGKLVLPFLIEEVRLQNAFSFYLSDVQQYRAYENREDALRSLIGRVRAVSGKAGDAAPLPAPETAAARPPKRPARALLWAGACIGGALLLALALTFFDLQDRRGDMLFCLRRTPVWDACGAGGRGAAVPESGGRRFRSRPSLPRGGGDQRRLYDGAVRRPRILPRGGNARPHFPPLRRPRDSPLPFFPRHEHLDSRPRNCDIYAGGLVHVGGRRPRQRGRGL